MGKEYIVVEWPQVQNLFELEGFAENSHLINDESGLEKFGDSAYFVDFHWLKKHKNIF